MTEYEIEPIPGLPGMPPAGEEILWQGKPDARVLARTAFHADAVAMYFAALAAIALVAALPHVGQGMSAFLGFGMTVGVGILGVAMLNILAWASARTTIYTITNRRVVLRIGIALPGCINLPLALIRSADLRGHRSGFGDVAMMLTGKRRLGYITLWPHARPMRMAEPEPMLRAIPDAARVATLLAEACAAAPVRQPLREIAAPATSTAPAFARVAA